MFQKSSLFIAFLGLSMTVFAQKEFQKKVQSEMILAEDGALIELPAGTFTLTNTLVFGGQEKNHHSRKGNG